VSWFTSLRPSVRTRLFNYRRSCTNRRCSNYRSSRRSHQRSTSKWNNWNV